MSEKKVEWYVAHTYSGYENKVKDSIEKTAENRGMQDIIQKVVVPLEEVIDDSNGKRKVVKHKIFPSYVFIKMIHNDESWYVVRNTRGVTGFVGPVSAPTPLTEDEVAEMGLEDIEFVKDGGLIDLDINVGETVNIVSGELEGFCGVVEKIMREERMLTMKVLKYGNEINVTLSIDQVKKV